MADLILEGSVGSSRIEHFNISWGEAKMASLRAVINGSRCALVDPGRHARLLVDGQVMMSDTRMERETNETLIRRASEHVLLAGLGLGMVIWPLLARRPRLHSLTVVEKSEDVIDLVAPHLPKDVRLTIIKGDIFDWLSAKKFPRFNTIYFDIWPSICSSNIPEARLLMEGFAGWASPGAWIGDWDTEVRRYDSVGPTAGTAGSGGEG
jgi:predicted membrane-bound spermidine synthase